MAAELDVLIEDMRDFAGEPGLRLNLESVARQATTIGHQGGTMVEGVAFRQAAEAGGEAGMAALTAVDQGMTGYKASINGAADRFEAMEAAVAGTLAKVTTQESGLPRMADEFVQQLAEDREQDAISRRMA